MDELNFKTSAQKKATTLISNLSQSDENSLSPRKESKEEHKIIAKLLNQ